MPGVFNYAYTYDPAGNITSIADAINPDTSKTYAYDALDRLSSAQGPWGKLAWTYDANGNRLSQQNGVKYTYTYDGNRLESIANGHIDYYRYDVAGNTTSDGKRDFIYNQNNRLIEALEAGRTLGEYVYNGKGQRVVKRTGPAATGSASGQTIVYHYDLNGRLIEETASNGKLLVDYVYLGRKPLAMIRKQGNDEESLYYHNDHLGTPKVMTDKLGKLVWSVEFDPFGNEVQEKGRKGSYIRAIENNLRFPGQYFDSETGLNQNHFRDYNTKTGRYIEADPLGLKGELNSYSYSLQKPISFIDPEGLLTVYIWSYRGKEEAWGHASLTLKDGTHISWWPSSDREQNPMFPDIYTAPANDPQLLFDDIELEGQAPDYQINIDCLDEDKIKQWWLLFKNASKWETLAQNCSTTAADALKAGGGTEKASWWFSNNYVWTPNDVKAFADSIKEGCECK